MLKTCRTCLLEIRDTTYIKLNDNDVQRRSVRAELLACIPKLDLNLVEDPVICRNCVNVLQLAYDFKTRCLRTERLIRSCIRNANLNGKPVTLTKLFRFSRVTNGGKNCSRLNGSVMVKDLDVLNSDPTLGERFPVPLGRATLDIEADNDDHERIDDYITSTENEDSNVVMSSEGSLVDEKYESDLENIITNNETTMGLTLQPPEFRDKILGCSSAGTCTDIVGQMLQDLDNMMNRDIVKEEHEILPFKTETNETSSLKNENANCEQRSNCYKTVNLSEVSNVSDGDVKEKTRSVTCDVDGNGLVGKEYEFSGDIEADNDECQRNNDYITSTANKDFIVMNSDVGRVDGEDKNESSFVTNSRAIMELTLQPLEFQENSSGSSTTPTQIMGEVSQDLHNEMDDDFVKEEHELTIKTETDEALSFKEKSSNNNDEKSSNDCKIDTFNDFMEETRSIKYDADGNNLVEEEYEFPAATHNGKRNFSEHQQAHSKNKSFCCNVCDYSTSHKINFTRHLLVHTGEKPFKCNVCEYSAHRKQNLIIHMRNHTGEKPFRCNFCDFSASYKAALTRHLPIHTGEKPFKCNVCDYRAAQKYDLIKHRSTHTGEKPFRCVFCDYSTSYKTSLTKHLPIHTGEKPFKCNVCDYRGVQKYDLIKHMRTHTGQKPYRCNVCGFSTAYKTHLTRHLRVHTGEKPFKCNVCEYSASHQKNLYNHIRIHTGEKPFRCKFCEFSTTRKEHLIPHMRTHTGEKPFRCNVCKYSATQKQHLNNHMRIHTREKPFQCNFCEYSATEKGILDCHMHIHTDEKPFQ